MNPMIFAGDNPLKHGGSPPMHVQISLTRKTSFIVPLEELPAGSLPRVVGEALKEEERSSVLGWAKRSGGSLVVDQNPLPLLGGWAADNTRYLPHHLLRCLLERTSLYGVVSLGKELHGCVAVQPGSVPVHRFLESVEEILG